MSKNETNTAPKSDNPNPETTYLQDLADEVLAKATTHFQGHRKRRARQLQLVTASIDPAVERSEKLQQQATEARIADLLGAMLKSRSKALRSCVADAMLENGATTIATASLDPTGTRTMSIRTKHALKVDSRDDAE